MDKQPLLNFIETTLANSGIMVSKQTLENIIRNFMPKTFAKNEYFVVEGKVNRGNFFMVDGFMRAFTHNLDGEEVTTFFYTKNHSVFEATSLYTQSKAMENIQAITDCSGFLLSFEDLNKLFHSIPEFREFGRAMLVKEFFAYKKRSLSLINKSAEERYAELMDNNKEIFQYAQLKYIASYLGITDTSLSRIRRDFAKKA